MSSECFARTALGIPSSSSSSYFFFFSSYSLSTTPLIYSPARILESEMILYLFSPLLFFLFKLFYFFTFIYFSWEKKKDRKRTNMSRDVSDLSSFPRKSYCCHAVASDLSRLTLVAFAFQSSPCLVSLSAPCIESIALPCLVSLPSCWIARHCTHSLPILSTSKVLCCCCQPTVFYSLLNIQNSSLFIVSFVLLLCCCLLFSGYQNREWIITYSHCCGTGIRNLWDVWDEYRPA